MSDRAKKAVIIRENKRISDGIFSMWLETSEISRSAKPGQFISMYTKDASKLLPRPISICDIDRENGLIRVVYRISGQGTLQFSRYRAGDSIDVLGPLGNGYCLDTIAGEAEEPASLMLVGGGIGIPPMLGLAKAYREAYPGADMSVVLGYRNSDTFLDEEFRDIAKVYYASDDGSIGIKGNVINAIQEYGIKTQVICACGPTPMLKGIQKYAAAENITAYISMEEKMACGIGACLACVCKTKEADSHSMVHNRRICKDGPVFRADEIELG